jgi:hypothetical protein
MNRLIDEIAPVVEWGLFGIVALMIARVLVYWFLVTL